jgi:cell division septum initiation protein DivIVA
MRSILLALSCLVVGVLGALGYSHYLGEGKQLADLQAELDTANAKLAKVTQDSKEAKSETDAMSAQIQQLTSTKDDLQKQVDDLKTSSPAAPTPANPMVGMAGMMKVGMAQHYEEELLMLESRLHLTPDQIAAVKAAMDAEGKRAEEMAAKMFSGGKIDPQTMADLKNFKSLDQTLKAILTPEQQAEYAQMQTDQKNSAAETMASVQMNQIAPLLQLSDSQKDQAYSALAQAQLDTQDPNWIKNNIPNASSDPMAVLEAQAKAKEAALANILTPDQMAIYHQQAQSQLAMQQAMMQKIMPTSGSVSVQVGGIGIAPVQTVTPTGP